MPKSYNTAIAKQTLLLNNAGDNSNNPILSGLPLALSTRFDTNAVSFLATIGTTDPPLTSITFVQDTEDSLLYKHNAIAGVAPFSANQNLFVRTLFNSETIWQRNLYIASLPSDAVQVYDITTSTWTSVNFDTMPSIIPTVCQQAGIRFFTSWYDEFRIVRFGGAKYVSIYDYGTALGDVDHYQVIRQEQEEIDTVQYIYLEKHVTAQVETHDITVFFNTAIDGAGVAVRVKVKTPSCLGYEVLNPISTYAEIDNIVFSGVDEIYNLSIKSGIKTFDGTKTYIVKRYATQSASVESGSYTGTYINSTNISFTTSEMTIAGWFEIVEDSVAINNPRTYFSTQNRTPDEAEKAHSATVTINYKYLFFPVNKTLAYFGEVAWHASWKLLDGLTVWLLYVDASSNNWVLSITGAESAFYVGPSSSQQPNAIYTKTTGSSLFSDTCEIFGGLD